MKAEEVKIVKEVITSAVSAMPMFVSFLQLNETSPPKELLFNFTNYTQFLCCALDWIWMFFFPNMLVICLSLKNVFGMHSFVDTNLKKYLGTNIWRNVQLLCMPGSKKWQFSPSWRRLGASVDSDQTWRDSYKKLQSSGNTGKLWNIQHLKRLKIHRVGGVEVVVTVDNDWTQCWWR